jgi:hypothetical protein
MTRPPVTFASARVGRPEMSWKVSVAPRHGGGAVTATPATPDRTELVRWNRWPDVVGWDSPFGWLLATMCRTGTREEDFAPGGEPAESDDAFVLELDLPAIASMDPKVDAACAFAETTGARAAIGSTTELSRVVAGAAGTAVRCATYGAALAELLLFRAHSEVGS